jgi:hypothetical protein
MTGWISKSDAEIKMHNTEFRREKRIKHLEDGGRDDIILKWIQSRVPEKNLNLLSAVLQ